MLSGTTNCAKLGGRCGVRTSASVKLGLQARLAGAATVAVAAAAASGGRERVQKHLLVTGLKELRHGGGGRKWNDEGSSDVGRLARL